MGRLEDFAPGPAILPCPEPGRQVSRNASSGRSQAMGGRIAPGFPSASPQDYKSLSSTDKERPPGMGRMDYPELGTRPPALRPSHAAGGPRHRASCLPTTSLDRPGTQSARADRTPPEAGRACPTHSRAGLTSLGALPATTASELPAGGRRKTPPRVSGSSPMPDTVIAPTHAPHTNIFRL
jgi:hypothetical protein